MCSVGAMRQVACPHIAYAYVCAIASTLIIVCSYALSAFCAMLFMCKSAQCLFSQMCLVAHYAYSCAMSAPRALLQMCIVSTLCSVYICAFSHIVYYLQNVHVSTMRIVKACAFVSTLRIAYTRARVAHCVCDFTYVHCTHIMYFAKFAILTRYVLFAYAFCQTHVLLAHE